MTPDAAAQLDVPRGNAIARWTRSALLVALALVAAGLVVAPMIGAPLGPVDDHQIVDIARRGISPDGSVSV